MSETLVTGGSGIIGLACVRELLGRGHTVTATYNSSKPEVAHERLEWHRFDLRTDDPAQFLSKTNAKRLVHLAWMSSTGGIWSSERNLGFALSSIEFFEAFANTAPDRMLGVGSCGEYDWATGLCVEAHTPLNASTAYGKSKNVARLGLEVLGAARGISTAWARPFFVYGPGEHESRIVANVASELASGREAACTHGFQIRDYTHIDDVGRGIVDLLESEFQGAMNIASGTPMRLRDIVDEIGSQLGLAHMIRYGAREALPHEPPIILADTTLARDVLGFTPRIDLETGIRSVLKPYLSGSR